jgi:hypothetical protein
VGVGQPAEDYQALLRPLFITGFLIEDFLDENDLFGARSVLLTSASSKTAISLAFQLKATGQGAGGGPDLGPQQGLRRRAGLLRPGGDLRGRWRRRRSRSRWCWSTSPATRRCWRPCIERFGEALAYSCLVGGTHWEAERGGGLCRVPSRCSSSPPTAFASGRPTGDRAGWTSVTTPPGRRSPPTRRDG